VRVNTALSFLTLRPPNIDRPPSYDPLAESQRLEDLEWFDETANHHQTLRFIGREAYIKVIHDAIESLTESPKTVVLQGLGGQGKTSLAIQYAHIYHKSRYKLIFWVDASSPSTAQYHYGRIVDARELMKGVSMPTERQKVDRFLRYLKSPEAECLIIFDNFDATDPEEHNAIATILPTGGERLSIIITSRNYGTSTYGHALHVDGMSDDEAMALLLDRSKFQASDLSAEQKEACLNILNDVGNLPLAVEQAAAYMHNRRMDPRVFLVESRENRENVIKYIPQGSAYKKLVGLQPGPEAEGIYINAFATWELSLVAVGGGERGAAETSMSPAARLMSLVAFLDRTLLPSFMFKNATMSVNPSSTRRWLTDSCQKNSQWDQTKFRGLVIDLANLSLIDFRDTPDHSEFEFSIHPLVQEWARIRLTESERLWFFQQAIWFVADFLQPDNYDPEHIKTKALILKHLDAILVYDNLLFKPSSQVYLGRKDLIPITMRFASFYLDHGIYSQTRNLYQKIIDRNAQPKNRKEKLFVFEAIEGVAIVEMLEGNFKRAQEYCEKALEGYTTLLGTRSQYRLRALHNLGEIHGAQGNFTDVFELFKEALTGCEETLGLDHLLTLREVEGLGNAHRVSKRYDEAANYYVRALEGMKKQLPENHPDLLGVIEGLGIVRKGQRRFEEAAELYSTALRGDEDYLGENHPDTLNVVEGLGDVYAATKDATRALSLYERVKNARSMVVGVEHPDTIRVIDKINELSCPTGNIDFQHDTAYYPWYRTISSDEEDMALEHNGLWSWISRFWRINA
jgi:tetratricopeptide (TPR) repeat protein